jgi:hypothetical protein
MTDMQFISQARESRELPTILIRGAAVPEEFTDNALESVRQWADVYYREFTWFDMRTSIVLHVTAEEEREIYGQPSSVWRVDIQWAYYDPDTYARKETTVMKYYSRPL